MLAPARIEQLDVWDCGIACARALLAALCAPVDAADAPALLAAIGVTPPSVHSIDVARLVARAAPRAAVELASTAIGAANGAHAALPFYAAAHAADATRLPAAFAAAAAEGVALRTARTPLDELRARLAHGGAAIVLCDAARLACASAGCARAAACAALLARADAGAYFGHYLVLVGVCDAAVRVLDPLPGACAKGCAVDITAVEAARAADGTDDDVIFVSLRAP